MNNKIVIGVVALVVGVASGFFGGMKYDQSKASAARAQAFAQFRGGAGGATGAVSANRRGGNAGGFGGARGGTGFVSGDILSADSTSITVAGQDGGSKIVFYSASTTVGKTTIGNTSDLAAGTFVMVNGTANSDGTISAQSIQIRPTPPTTPNTATIPVRY